MQWQEVGKRCSDISNYGTFGGKALDSKACSVDQKKKEKVFHSKK